MKNKAKGLTIAALLPVLCMGQLLPLNALAAGAYTCDEARTKCADRCGTAKFINDSEAKLQADHPFSGENVSESALRAENREEYRICLNNCDAQYNACESRRVQEDYDD